MSRDDVCENFIVYRRKYESSTQFCSNSSAACTGDGPVMAIDTTDPDNPHWYVVGFFLYAHQCDGGPKIFTKVAPYMDWILENMMEPLKY